MHRQPNLGDLIRAMPAKARVALRSCHGWGCPQCGSYRVFGGEKLTQPALFGQIVGIAEKPILREYAFEGRIPTSCRLLVTDSAL
jgi:hypothetical protein